MPGERDPSPAQLWRWRPQDSQAAGRPGSLRRRAPLVAVAGALVAAQAAGAAAVAGGTTTLLCAETSCALATAAPLAPRDATLVLENLDHGAVARVSLARPGHPDLSSNEAIVAAALRGRRTPEERALGLWELVRDWRYNCPPLSAQSAELHDPVKLINLFGCGHCDDASAALAVLAKLAGFKARVWGLGGHVVAELEWEGAWHMLDASRELYFRDQRGEVASVEQLAARPVLIESAANRALDEPLFARFAAILAGSRPRLARAADGDRVSNHFLAVFRRQFGGEPPASPAALRGALLAPYARLFSTTEDNAPSSWWTPPASTHRMELALFPGDRATLEIEPVDEARLNCYTQTDWCYQGRGRVERAALRPLLVTPDAAAGGRELVLRERLPWLLTGLELASSAAPAKPLAVELSLDGAVWTAIGRLERGGTPLAYRFPAAGPALPSSFWLRIRPPAGAPAPAPEALRLTSSFAFAPRSVPWPATGEPTMIRTGVTGRFAGLRTELRWRT